MSNNGSRRFLAIAAFSGTAIVMLVCISFCGLQFRQFFSDNHASSEIMSLSTDKATNRSLKGDVAARDSAMILLKPWESVCRVRRSMRQGTGFDRPRSL